MSLAMAKRILRQSRLTLLPGYCTAFLTTLYMSTLGVTRFGD